MELKEFMDISKLQKIQDNFSDATGLAAIAVGNDGQYLTEGSNFTDFCMKYTRGSKEGNRRCVKCDNEGSGTYLCHAGLMDFSVDIKVGDEKMGAIIGGQILPEAPDEESFRKTAKELGIDEDEYIAALNKVTISSEEKVRAATNLLELIVNQLVNLEYYKYTNTSMLHALQKKTQESASFVDVINKDTSQLKAISSKHQNWGFPGISGYVSMFRVRSFYGESGNKRYLPIDRRTICLPGNFCKKTRSRNRLSRRDRHSLHIRIRLSGP